MPKLVRLDGSHHVSTVVRPAVVFQPMTGDKTDKRPHAVVDQGVARKLMKKEPGCYGLEYGTFAEEEALAAADDELTPEQMQARIAALEAQLAASRKPATPAVDDAQGGKRGRGGKKAKQQAPEPDKANPCGEPDLDDDQDQGSGSDDDDAQGGEGDPDSGDE